MGLNAIGKNKIKLKFEKMEKIQGIKGFTEL